MPATAKVNPSFRADHVGSLLRPKALLDSRYAKGDARPSPEALKALEDRFVPEVIALQERVGMPSITDGEFRRGSFRSPVVSKVEGFVTVSPDATYGQARDEAGKSHPLGDVPFAKGRLRRTKGIATDEFAFLKKHTKGTPKICLPAPSYHHYHLGDKAADRTVYPDMEAYFDDLVRVFREEVEALAALGATYIQFDEVIQAYLCDDRIREWVRSRGDDPDALSRRYVDLINRIVTPRPPGVTFAVHFCRGNSMGRWVAEGGYDHVAGIVFPGLEVDALRRRIDEAAKLVPLERLCLSPQCGFASRDLGNPITQDDQIAKLDLVVRVATEVWGGVAA